MRALFFPAIFCLVSVFMTGPTAQGEEEEIGRAISPEGHETESEFGSEEPSRIEKKVLELFNSSQKYYKDGRITLIYDFRSHDESLLLDWRPTIDQMRKRLRWTGPYEVTSKPGGSSYLTGLLVADYGQWFHKAIFLPDLSVKIRMRILSHRHPDTLIGPVFYNDKMKLSLGSNRGNQLFCVKGSRPRHARPPHPKKGTMLPYYKVQTISYKYMNNVFECHTNGRKTTDSTEAPKLIKDFDTGRPGVAWNGKVQGFIRSITIEGKLDADWISKELGEE